jgi:NAD(P)-dependent dehydrogenase (short-subunit alcohol dehydrogenase family)
LTGKTAIVTGGGSGIGAAVAHTLAGQGAQVVVTGRTQSRLDEVVRSGPAAPPIHSRTSDVGDRKSVRELFAWVGAELGHVDILVNSAGVNIPNRGLKDLAPEDWDQVLQINTTGCFNCIWSVLPEMRKRRDGVIVNIASIAGCRASLLGGVAYSASKFAMAGLGLTVGLEEREQGIRVTTIYPGEVETPILEQRPQPVTAEHRSRILQPEDVAAAVLLVAQLPARAHIPELVIKPTCAAFS